VLEVCRAATLDATAGTEGHIAVISATPGEGRTTLATGLAMVQRHDYGRTTLLLEIDTLRPLRASQSIAHDASGLADVLRGDVEADDCMRWVDERFAVMTAGRFKDDPERVLTELMTGDVLPQLFEQFQAVVANMPPILTSRTSAWVASRFSAQVMVVRAGVTPLPRVRESIAALPSAPVVVLNGVQSSLPRWMRRFSDTR
jgi:Mrp family chromosome partitioning ATPase